MASVAEDAKFVAEARKLEAEALKYEAQARGAQAQASEAELDYVKSQRAFDRMLASDEEQRVYRFSEGVRDSSVENCIGALSTWSRLDPGCEITIVFYSPGGSVTAGMALYDFIRDLQNHGHRIITKALGYAASMAGILLQVGDERVMGRESWLLIHQGSAGASGSMGEIEDTVDWFRRIDERILDIFYERAKQSNPAKPLSRATIKKRYERKDWWLDSAEALRHGFCDRVE
jgi:ATP-dependent Clp endopeptidase proteolytic subunit ClpP